MKNSIMKCFRWFFRFIVGGIIPILTISCMLYLGKYIDKTNISSSSLKKEVVEDHVFYLPNNAERVESFINYFQIMDLGTFSGAGAGGIAIPQVESSLSVFKQNNFSKIFYTCKLYDGCLYLNYYGIKGNFTHLYYSKQSVDCLEPQARIGLQYRLINWYIKKNVSNECTLEIHYKIYSSGFLMSILMIGGVIGVGGIGGIFLWRCWYEYL